MTRRDGHICHVRACRAPCPPRWLTCSRCWGDVPRALQTEVYRTVKLRDAAVNASWAPWWRAQARAIDAVLRAGVASGRWQEIAPGTFDALLAKDLEFADHLERRARA